MRNLIKKISREDYKGLRLIEEKEVKGNLLKSELFLSYYSYVKDEFGSLISFMITKLNIYDDNTIVVLDTGYESYNNNEKHLSEEEILEILKNLKFKEVFIKSIKANDCSMNSLFYGINDAFREYNLIDKGVN